MSNSIITPEISAAIEHLKSKLKNTFDRDVGVEIIESGIDIPILAHSLQIVITLGNYKRPIMVSLAELSQTSLIAHLFGTVYLNFVYQFIKDAAKHY